MFITCFALSGADKLTFVLLLVLSCSLSLTGNKARLLIIVENLAFTENFSKWYVTVINLDWWCRRTFRSWHFWKSILYRFFSINILQILWNILLFTITNIRVFEGKIRKSIEIIHDSSYTSLKWEQYFCVLAWSLISQ